MDTMMVPQESAPSLREFLLHMRAGRGRSLGIFGAVLGLALIVAALLPPRYRATATLAVFPSPEFTVRGTAGSHDANASALALDQIMKAETALLDSDDLHDATLRKLGQALVYPDIFAPSAPGLVARMAQAAATALLCPWRVSPADPRAARDQAAREKFESHLTLLPAKDANVISVSFDNPDPAVAAAAVNTLLSLYAARRSGFYSDPQLAVVGQSVERAAAAVAEADRRLAAFKRSQGISDYDQQRDMLLHRRSAAEQAAADTQAARSEQLARVLSLTRQLRAEPSTIGIFREHDPDTRLLAVNAGLQDTRTKLAAARDKYLDTSRVVASLRSEIGAQQAEADRLGHDRAASVVREGRNPNLEALRLDRARAATELAAAQARLSAQLAERDATQAALDRLTAWEPALAALLRAKAAAEDSFATASRILADRHISEAEDRLRLANVRVIQPAIVPQRPRALPLLVIAAGAILGMLAAFGRIVGDFVLHPVFLTGEGLALASGLPVLAVFGRDDEAFAETDLVG